MAYSVSSCNMPNGDVKWRLSHIRDMLQGVFKAPLLSANSLEFDLLCSADQKELLSESFDASRRSSLGSESVLEHDLADENFDLTCCSDSMALEARLGLEYADDIYKIKRQAEITSHPRDCMKHQPEITKHMRCTLVNWLIKVSAQLGFGSETPFLAVGYVDQFLSNAPVAQDCLQLLATCALFVAAKIEETTLPNISSLVALCGTAYKRHHFIRMESLLLTNLKFELQLSTVWYFFTDMVLRISKLCAIDRRLIALAQYSVETCLSSYEVTQYLPSCQGASGLVTAAFLLSSATGPDRKGGTLLPCLRELSNSTAVFLATVIEMLYSEDEYIYIENCSLLMSNALQPFLQSSEPNTH